MLKIPITGKPLKSCPFCGGNNMSLFEECVDFMNFKDCIYTIECNRCNANIKRYSVTGVKRAWNRRELEGKAFVDGYKKGMNFFT